VDQDKSEFGEWSDSNNSSFHPSEIEFIEAMENENALQISVAEIAD